MTWFVNKLGGRPINDGLTRLNAGRSTTRILSRLGIEAEHAEPRVTKGAELTAAGGQTAGSSGVKSEPEKKKKGWF
jgi:hypothetical protein